MKVLIYFSGKLNEPKGTPIRTHNMLAQLAAGGFEVFYAGHDDPAGMDASHILSLASPVVRVAQLIRFVRENRIDIVYFQTSAGLYFAVALRLFTRAKIGIDFHSRRYQEEHAYHDRTAVVTEFLEFTERLACRLLHFGTSVSYKLQEYYGAVVPAFLVLPVGVDTVLFSPSIEALPSVLAWKGSAVVIGYAGNAKWYQGVGTILEAFRSCEEQHPGAFKLLIVSSSATDELREYAKKHGLERQVMIVDKQPHDDVPKFLAAADILTVVRPSTLLTEYAFPSKLSEYAALGKALVVGKVGDVEHYLVDGLNACIVPPDDAAATATAFEKLSEPPYRNKLSQNARALALSDFDLNAVGRKMVQFLLSLN